MRKDLIDVAVITSVAGEASAAKSNIQMQYTVKQSKISKNVLEEKEEHSISSVPVLGTETSNTEDRAGIRYQQRWHMDPLFHGLDYN